MRQTFGGSAAAMVLVNGLKLEYGPERVRNGLYTLCSVASLGCVFRVCAIMCPSVVAFSNPQSELTFVYSTPAIPSLRSQVPKAV